MLWELRGFRFLLNPRLADRAPLPALKLTGVSSSVGDLRIGQHRSRVDSNWSVSTDFAHCFLPVLGIARHRRPRTNT